jgi:hypothetical protein
LVPLLKEKCLRHIVTVKKESREAARDIKPQAATYCRTCYFVLDLC